jgi:hypothetical protein
MIADDKRLADSSSPYWNWLFGLGVLGTTIAVVAFFTGRGHRKLVVRAGVPLTAAAILIGVLGGSGVSLVAVAHAACGSGCSCTQCYEAINGNEVLLRDPCCKLMQVDPPNGLTPGGGSTFTLFEYVDNDAGCNTAGGLGAARINCPEPTGNWEVAIVDCDLSCDE